MPVSKNAKEENFPRGGVTPTDKGKKFTKKPALEKDLFQTISTDKKAKKRKASQEQGGKKKSKAKKARLSEQLQSDISRIVPITSQSLVEGSLVLGCVKDIHDFEIVVSLPGSQTGVVPITDISDAYTQQLQQLADQDNISEDVHGLSSLFFEGQVLRCCVTQKGGSQKIVGTKRKHVSTKLSINPCRVNQALSASSIKPGMVLSGTVKSCEDHGYVIDLGMSGVNGFLKKKQAKHCLSDALGIGSNLFCLISPDDALSLMSGDSRVVNVDIRANKVSAAQVTECMSVNMSTLLPGMIVEATVQKVTNDGASVRFLGYSGVVSRHHLVTNPHSITSKQKLLLGVLHINPVTKAVHLTELPHLIKTPVKKSEFFGGLAVGDIIEEAKVVKVFPKLGLLMRLAENLNGIAFLRHISDASDFNVNDSFSKGDVHRCRVIDFDLADRLVILSLKKSVLEQKFMSYNDITPGAKIVGHVRGVHNKGVSVSITTHIKGFIPLLHLADILLKHPEKKFSEGDKVKCKVLSVDSQQKKVILSHKRSLITSKLPMLMSYGDCVKDAIYEGFIVDIKQRGVLVVFYNNVRGWVPKSQLSDSPIDDPQHVFYLGQVVKCRVLKCEDENLLLSFRLEGKKTFASGPVDLPSDFEVGKKVQCELQKTTDENLVVMINSKHSALLPRMHLSDHADHCDALWEVFKQRKVIADAMYLSSNTSIILSKKPSLIKAAETGSLVTNFSQLKPGLLLSGVVKKLMAYGVFVDLLNGLIGLAPNKYICDRKITDPSTVLKEGQSVVAKVIEVDNEKQRSLLSLRMSDCYHGDTEMGLDLLQEWLDEYSLICSSFKSRKGVMQKLGEHSVGECLKVTITAVNEQGVLVETTESKIKGFATHEHLHGIGADVGKMCEAMVLFVDQISGILELTINTDTIKAVKNLKKTIYSEARVGQVIKSEVLLVKPGFVLAILRGHAAGRLTFLPAKRHLNDIFEKHLFVVGQINPVVIKRVTGDQILSSLQIHEASSKPDAVSSSKQYAIGSVTTAVIQSVLEHQLNVKVGVQPGRVHKTEILDSITDGTNPLAAHAAGDTVKVKVIGYRDQPGHKSVGLSPKSLPLLECSLRPSVIESKKVEEERKLEVGSKVIAFITKHEQSHIMAEVTCKIRGKVSQVNVSTDPAVMANMRKYFKVGCGYLSHVTKVIRSDLLELSLVETDVMKSDAVVSGVVFKTKPERGIFVDLPHGHHGIVPLSHLHDNFTDFPLENMSKDKVVKCFVLSCDSPQSCVLSMRGSRMGCTSEITDSEVSSLSDLTEGQILRGYVTNCSPNAGVFVNLGHDIVGRVSLTNLSDFFIKSPANVFQPGKVVTAKVLSINPESKKIDLSLRKSETGQEEVIPEEFKVGPRLSEDEKPKKVKSDTAPSKQSKPSRKRKREEDNVEHTKRARYYREEETDSGVDVREEPEVKIVSKSFGNGGVVAAGFDWNATTFTLPAGPSTVNVSESDESDSASEEEEAENKKPCQRKTKQQRLAEKQAKEENLRKIEEERLTGEGQPQTADEFDRLLLQSPNSSMVWLRYMAFHLQSSEIEKARAVAKRALKTISFREEQEKMNVWVAYLNLENLYGTPEQLQTVFNDALQQVPRLGLYQQLAAIYTRSNKTQAAEQLYVTMVKKFKQEKEVWINFGLFYFRDGKFDAAREIMQKSLKSLLKKQHVEVISKFAQMEFKYGEPERGKTMFETLLSTYPRRTDLWSVYIDMIIKLGNMDAVRELFERVIHLQMSVKKMKSLFKKYLDFEEKYGDEASVNSVRQKALTYVGSKTAIMDVDE